MERPKQILSEEFSLLTKSFIKYDIYWMDVPQYKINSTQDKSLKYICRYGNNGSIRKSLFEFGTWIGRSAFAFSQNFDRVVTMDCAEATDRGYSYLGLQSGEYVRNVPNVQRIYHDSAKYDFSLYSNQFDVVYVDGNHTYEGAKCDITTATKILKDKGIIFIDDYPNDDMGVKKAVNEFDHSNKYWITDLDLVAFVNV